LREFYRWRWFPLWLLVVASPLAFLVWFGSGVREPPAQTASKCVEQIRPPVGDYFVTDFADRVAPFTVETSVGSDYLVKLERADDRYASLTFYIVGGQRFETEVPLGVYTLKYLAGSSWCGPQLLFGTQHAEQGRTLFTFTVRGDRYAGHTVTLYRVPHGNFSTQSIPARDF
jgi:hypothetical protein